MRRVRVSTTSGAGKNSLEARRGVAGQGKVWQGVARQGCAGRGKARQGKAIFTYKKVRAGKDF